MPWNDSDRLTENVDMASQYTTNLKEQMDPLAKNLMTKITKGADMLRERIEVEVSTVRCALKPYIEYVTSPFEKGAEYIRESLDFEDLKATVLQKSEELRESLEQGVKELQAKLEPSAWGKRWITKLEKQPRQDHLNDNLNILIIWFVLLSTWLFFLWNNKKVNYMCKTSKYFNIAFVFIFESSGLSVALIILSCYIHGVAEKLYLFYKVMTKYFLKSYSFSSFNYGTLLF